MPPDHSSPSRRFFRRQIFVAMLAITLVAGGFFVLLVLKRVPLPARIVVASSDIFGGLALAFLLYQNRSGSRRPQ